MPPASAAEAKAAVDELSITVPRDVAEAWLHFVAAKQSGVLEVSFTAGEPAAIQTTQRLHRSLPRAARGLRRGGDRV